MRISDWSSDVCSSDLFEQHLLQAGIVSHHQYRAGIARLVSQAFENRFGTGEIEPLVENGIGTGKGGFDRAPHPFGRAGQHCLPFHAMLADMIAPQSRAANATTVEPRTDERRVGK